jgi:hypothetical protein
MGTVVTFESAAFNTVEAKEHCINPTCFGDDLAAWLMHQLQGMGVETDEEPDQEDFGWYFSLRVPEGEHCCVLSYRPGDPGCWVAWLETSRGLLASLSGVRHRRIASSASAAIHRALSGAPEVTGFRWHEKADFDRGHEDSAAGEPWGA